MSWIDLRPEVSKLTKPQLQALVQDLYKTSKNNRDFLEAKFHTANTGTILQEHEDTIVKEFFPKRGFGKVNLKAVAGAISDYKKLTSDTEGTLHLMLTYVEQGTAFINEYSGIKENAYDSMMTTFRKFCQALRQPGNRNLLPKFRTRVEKLMKDVEGIGYGFGDEVSCDGEELLEFMAAKKG